MSLGKLFKKAVRLANPVTAAIDVTNQAFGANTIKDPTVKAFGTGLNLAEMTSPVTAISAGLDTSAGYEANRQNEIAKKQQKDNLAADEADFQKFQSQDLLNSVDTNTPLYTPAMRANGGRAKEIEAMTQLFNQRKSDILARQRTPGINQTRLF
jgi:hypothetical protein